MRSKLAPVLAVFAVQLICQPVLPEKVDRTFDGHAHWYGGRFHGRRTASGAVFDKMKLTAAHPNLPFGTKVKVTSLYSHKSVTVVVNDRCPPLRQRCIDLSEGAARQLGIYPYAPCAVHCEVVRDQLAQTADQL